MTGTLRTLGWIAFGLAALVQTGCIAAIAGVAGAGAVAGYMYSNGLLYRDYRSNLPTTLAAVRTALATQKFVIDGETTTTDSVTVQTKTADGYTVRVHLDLVPGSVPGDGAVTRVGVRVGLSGDETVSARILDEVGRLVPSVMPAAPLPPAVPATVNSPAVQPQTAAPPLAGPDADRSGADPGDPGAVIVYARQRGAQRALSRGYTALPALPARTSIAELPHLHLAPEHPVDRRRVRQHERQAQQATASMMPSVFSDEAAFATVRLFAASRFETIMYGNSVAPKGNVNAAIVQDDDRKA